jgi:hypothetical protein
LGGSNTREGRAISNRLHPKKRGGSDLYRPKKGRPYIRHAKKGASKMPKNADKVMSKMSRN